MSAPITLTVQPARSELQVSSAPQLVYLLITARTVADARRAVPLNVCLVLDRSSSMRGDRLFHVKEAGRYVVSQMDSSDAFGLVAFNDRAEVIVQSHPVCDHDTIYEAIGTLDARGGTEMAQGLAVGLQEIERPKTNGLNRLILLTDGRTYGDEHACVELARRAQRRGIGLTALGIGTEWNEDLLEMMTAAPNNRTHYIASTKEIVSVFETELTRLKSTIAQSVEFAVGLHPSTEIRSMHRVQPFITSLQPQSMGNGVWRVPIGEWAGGEDQTFMLELVVPPLGPAPQPVARIDLRYELTGTSSGQSAVSAAVRLPAVAQPSKTINHDVRNALERVVAYQLQSRAWQSVAEGRIDDATMRLQMAGTHLFNAGEVKLAETVHVEATRLLQGGSTSADGRKRIRYGTRGLVSGG